MADALGRDLPDGPSPADQVVDLLAGACEPGLTAMPSGRFFGFVVGGSQPAALAADWLVGRWDQNAAMRQVTPAVAAVEEVAAGWLVDLLGLPAGTGVGFATGATTANFTAVLAGRDSLLRRAGWDVGRGLAGGPAIRVLAGRERHDSVDLALRYARPPRPRRSWTSTGRAGWSPTSLRDALAAGAGDADAGAAAGRQPALRCLRPVRGLHRGSPTTTTRGCTSTAPSGCGPPPRRRTGTLTAGVEGADSWATDAHKTLNVPYDCGVALVRDAGGADARR